MDPDLITTVLTIVGIISVSLLATLVYLIIRSHTTKRGTEPEEGKFDIAYPIVINNDVVDIIPPAMMMGRRYEFRYHGKTWVAVRNTEKSVDLYIVKKRRRWSRKDG